jgi:hypothetical protein
MNCINREPGAVAMGGYHSTLAGTVNFEFSGSRPSLPLRVL